jgi:ABC-type uncharacterized transport system permease subunit
MLLPMEEATVDRKPSRLVALYIPTVLGLLTGLFAAPACDCTLPKLLLLKTVCAIAAIAVWWIIIMAGFHGFHFVKSIFHHPR